MGEEGIGNAKRNFIGIISLHRGGGGCPLLL